VCSAIRSLDLVAATAENSLVIMKDGQIYENTIDDH
jgi:hypothetical protein